MSNEIFEAIPLKSRIRQYSIGSSHKSKATTKRDQKDITWQIRNQGTLFVDDVIIHRSNLKILSENFYI